MIYCAATACTFRGRTCARIANKDYDIHRVRRYLSSASIRLFRNWKINSRRSEFVWHIPKMQFRSCVESTVFEGGKQLFTWRALQCSSVAVRMLEQQLTNRRLFIKRYNEIRYTIYSVCLLSIELMAKSYL